jgi:S1-C subfamily serine protease
MKKYLIGLSGTILAIALILLSTLPLEALAAPSERFSGGYLSAGQPASGHDLEEPRHEKIRESTGELTEKRFHELLAGGSTGTAWPISSGYVVTNSHVISEGTTVILVSPQGQEIPARVVLRDQASDIVLLEVKDPRTLPPALPLAQIRSRLGTSVFTIGFPRVDFMGRAPKLSIGVISGENGLHDDPENLQTTVPIQPGNSGGPLLNMKGEVVGVVKSMVGIRNETTGDLSVLQTLSCALKIKGVQELLPRLPQKDPQINVLPNLSDDLETLAGRIKDSVLLVISKKVIE